jgi:hypothetical protein
MVATPNTFALVMIFGWPLIAVALFLFMPPRRALLAGFVFGWLFLPVLIPTTPLVLWDKHLVTSLGALVGVLLFDTGRLLSFRPRLLDITKLIWCLAPIPATLTNGLGAYTATAETLNRLAEWGVPYLLGRVYFNDLAGMRALAAWIFMAGLIYVPFCLFEIRLSPQLHRIVYGYSQYEFSQVVRMGGYRPTVFLQHGLALGMLMSTASLAGIWLWYSGAVKRVFNVSALYPLGALLITTLFVKSAGALLLLVAAVALLFLTRKLRVNWLVIFFCAAPVGYMVARGVLNWDGSNAVQLVGEFMESQRADSLQFRLDNERKLLDKALERRVFGWGPNGRNRTTDENGIEAIPDGYWVIALGTNGLVGLVALYTALLLPVPLLLMRIKAESWSAPAFAAVCAVALILPMHAIDNLFNAMLNPLFVLAAGGITAMAADPTSLLLPTVATIQRARRRRFGFGRPARPAPTADPDSIAVAPDNDQDALNRELGIQ